MKENILTRWPVLQRGPQSGSLALTPLAEARCKPVHLYWGYGIVWIYAISWIAPGMSLQYFRLLYLASAALWVPVMYWRLGLKPKLCWPVTLALVLQVWSIFTAVYGAFHMARPIGLGRADFYLLEHMVPFFVAVGMVQLDKNARVKIAQILLVVLGISAAVAWLQFFKIPGASALARWYTYKDIDFWDGTVGLRAVGLTFHPGVLAAEGLMGLAIAGSRVIVAMPKARDVLLMFFFSGAVVFSQARAMYLVLGALWLFFAVTLMAKDRLMGTRVLGVLAALLCLALIFGQRRLGYAFQSSSLSEDKSYEFRAEVVWSQLDPIYPRFAVTGIGPSSGLMLGTGPEDTWVQTGRVMESCYRLMLAMYGLPGFIVFVCAVFGSIILTLGQVLSKGVSGERKRWMVSGFAVSCAIAIASYTANLVDGYVVLPYAFLIAGMCVASRPDEQLEWQRARAQLGAEVPALPRGDSP